MVHVPSLSVICSALVGLSNAAALGTAEEYADGTVHARIMAMKTAQWDAEIASGEMDSTRYPELGYTSCENGFAAAIPGDFNNTFKCHNVGLLKLGAFRKLLTCEDRSLPFPSTFPPRQLSRPRILFLGMDIRRWTRVRSNRSI
ncbi:hypothetical protein IG631_07326 [Alternaria alternata]|nr:hypothetical protein IG631_07326 [Alternaria alternata]